MWIAIPRNSNWMKKNFPNLKRKRSPIREAREVENGEFSVREWISGHKFIQNHFSLFFFFSSSMHVWVEKNSFVWAIFPFVITISFIINITVDNLAFGHCVCCMWVCVRAQCMELNVNWAKPQPLYYIEKPPEIVEKRKERKYWR